MECCLLCLEINNDMLDTISAKSKQWQELDIDKTIKKHFWPLDTIQDNSWICLSCWREVEGFHKFYLRVEEAHTNFGKIKLGNSESDKNNIVFCFLEPEIQIEQKQRCSFTESAILTENPQNCGLLIENKMSITEPLSELDCDDVPLKFAYKRLRPRSDMEGKDPLEKPKRANKKNMSKAKVSAEKNKTKGSKVKTEPVDLKHKDFNRTSNNCNKVSDSNDKADCLVAPQSKRRRANSKHHPNRKENDKFIAEHFKEMFCDLCKVPFEDFPDMQKHFSEIHSQRGYVICCKRKFSDRTRLVDHLHCHLNPDHFKCNQCGKIMSDRIKFDNHMLRVHRANEVVKQHCCDVCGKSFREAYVLRTHKLTHLPEEEKKFPCIDCGRNYGSAYLLNQHRQVVHLKRFVKVCYICGREINSSAEFKAHMNKHEGISPPAIYCDVCGLRLTSERGLKVHKESQHPVGGKQKHPCPLCDKISPTARALKKHINTMHEKGFDHKCTMCEKAFRRADTLKEHMASHTGTPLYSCPWCPMTFNSNGNMHAHRKNKHPKEYLELKLQNYSFPLVS